MGNSFEFEYTLEELKEIEKDLHEPTYEVAAFVRWLKRRPTDDERAMSSMFGIVQDVFEAGSVDNLLKNDGAIREVKPQDLSGTP